MAIGPKATNKQKPADFRLRGTDVTRLEAFSDVVFGFALTLLVVSLEVPRTFNELLADMRGFLPFAVSFAILAQVWWIHHKYFRRYGLHDALTATLNFALLFVVVFYVYPLKFVFTGLFNQITGYQGIVLPNGKMEPWINPDQVPLLMIIYGLGYAVVFFLFACMYWHALRKRHELDLNALEVFDTQTSIFENGFLCFVGVLCGIAAATLPARLAGLAGFLFFLIPIGFAAIGSRRRDARQKLTASLASPTSPEEPGS